MAALEIETAIIGAGQAGVPLARALAGAGRQVALVERNHPGGSCVNWGCTPSKAMIASSRLAAQARRASEWGIRVPRVEVDFAAVMDRARGMVEGARGELEESLAAQANLRLVRGHARLDGREGDGRFRLRVGDETLLAREVVLDTGTRSARPPVEGLDRLPPERLIDAENWIDRRELPESVVFLGGGTIALEMAQAWRRFGAAVTIVESGPRLADREDEEVSAELRDALEAEGVSVRCGAKAGRAEPTGGGVRLHLGAGGTLEATHLFVATGRRANTDDLGLDTVGLEPGKRGEIEVDGRLRTKVPGLFAAGDIRGGGQFTHTAYDDHRVLESQILGDGSRTTERILPYAIFTEPELGRVGMTEAQAREAGHRVLVGRQPMTESGKAREIGRTRGFIKVVAEAGSRRVLGAAALCESGSEVVQLFIELMNAGAAVDTMLDAVHIHPTLGEAAKNAAAALKDA
ncbi:FAD-containing oxidoreductase [Craurococcus roseus]|uniref:FAD-containing oxidoreductase n=1 Tax=Craurococcus roseus TaxID=77585 RepID=A0ABN1G2Q5_9PROT